MTTKVATTTPMVATHTNAPPSATSGQVATPAATPTQAIIQELVASCDAVRLSGAPENEKKTWIRSCALAGCGPRPL